MTSSRISSVPAPMRFSRMSRHTRSTPYSFVARAPVDLDALVGDRDGDMRGVELRHRDLADGLLAVHEPPRGRVDHLPRALDLRRHLGELVARDLEAADRAAERGPLLRVL